MIAEMISRQLDAHRRLVMPATCPAGAAVVVQQLDAETYLLRVQRPAVNYKVVLIPALDKLPDDPAWEAKELEAAEGLLAHLEAPEF